VLLLPNLALFQYITEIMRMAGTGEEHVLRQPSASSTGAPSSYSIFPSFVEWALFKILLFSAGNGMLIFACLAIAVRCLVWYVKYLKHDGPLDRQEFDKLIERIKPHL
jgi:hypothetical protein